MVKIDPGVDVDQYVPFARDNDHFSFGDRKTVLYCGDYTVEQGPRKLVEAVPDLIRAVPEALVVIAARDKNAEHLKEKELVKQEIVSRGLESHVRVLEQEWRIPELIAASDVGILPADAVLRKLDIPLILLEFLASGKPIVVPDIPPLNEIMRDEVGVLLRENTKEEIAATLAGRRPATRPGRERRESRHHRTPHERKEQSLPTVDRSRREPLERPRGPCGAPSDPGSGCPRGSSGARCSHSPK